MFWRRGHKKPQDAAAASDAQDGEDDLAKLQRQFGIKTVSDKDVEAEFLQLLGGSGKKAAGKGGAAGLDLGLSPRSQLALFGDGGDDSDEEAKIMRELNLTGNIDSIDVGELSAEDEDDDDDDEGAKLARRELRGVLGDAHRSAKQSNAGSLGGIERSDVAPRLTTVSSGEEMKERIHSLKLKAVTLKREGNVQEALAVFREVKTLEAQLTSEGKGGGVTVTTTSSRTVTSAVVTGGNTTETRQQQRVVQSTTSFGSGYEEEKDVEVTDEDMENPEYLAQLAALGLSVGPSRPKKPTATIESLEREIRETKERALAFKREDRISEALAEMRKIKELENKLAELRSNSAPVPTMPVTSGPTAGETALDGSSGGGPVFGAVPIVAFEPVAAEEEEVEVTDDDLNDPAYAAELAKMGFDPNAMGDDDDESKEEAEDPPAANVAALVAESTQIAAALPQSRSQYVAKQYSSMDDNDLIDEFDEEDEYSDQDPNDDHDKEHTVEEEKQSRDTASSFNPPAVTVQELPSQVPASDSEATASSGFSIEELQAQLQQVKITAVQLKRQGNLDGALDMMRRMKQIESLIDMKRRQPQLSPVVASAPTLSPQDIARDRQFQEMEALLVRFANDATREAKEQLNVNRAKAAEWLARRKEYSAHLATLREKRLTPGQDPPRFEIQQLTEEIEVEQIDLAPDEVQFRIESVNGLKQAAGKEVMVKFNLAFPSSAPHEGKSGVVRVSTSPPFSSGPIRSENAFRFNVQRSRGTQRLFEIKKATFEVWRPGTMLRNPEFVARGYQELAPLLTASEVRCNVPFVGPNRKPVGGDVEIIIRMRTPLRDKQYRTLVTEVLTVGEYPRPRVPIASLPSVPSARPPSYSEPGLPSNQQDSRPHSQSDAATRIPASAAQPTAAGLPHTRSAPSIRPAAARPPPVAAPAPQESVEDPHDLDLFISYDVINDEIERIEAALPTMQGDAAAEFSDRLDALGLKKQLLEIDMQTEKLTLDMYVAKLKQRIIDDRQIIVRLMKSGRKPDAARVLRRVKLMEKELEGADDQGDTGEADA